VTPPRTRGAKDLGVPEPDPERYREATELAERAAMPAQSKNVSFGTAGWTDKTLIGSGTFYPPGASSAEARLKHYASNFALVEVDATYYTLLAPEIAERWITFTPDDFCFDVKAHPIVTGHPVDVTRLPSDIKGALEAAGHEKRVYPDRMPSELADEIERRFRDFIQPLASAGKLGCVMAQFPPWFVATRGNAKKLERLAERWPNVPISVEFRHKSWLLPERRDRVFELLRAHGFSYVVVDEPDVAVGGVPPIVEVTQPELALVRFHGHNRSGWTKKGASVWDRFDYLYTPVELAAWVEPVKRLAREAKQVHALFNNCVRNYAVLGAKGLSVLLEP